MARIFDIQRFSIHDGPGIRTTIFLKGCSLRCRWCQNPEGLEGALRLWHFPNLCTRSGKCVKVCPCEALSLVEGGVAIDGSRCDLCGLCVEACPTNALAFDGREIETAEAIEQLVADRVFFEKSGGGVTFSGGDPLSQAGFVEEVARALKAQGIHTALETALFAPWETIERLLAVIDLFIVDVKVADPVAHAAATGQDNALILANLAKLAQALKDTDRLLVRVPLIPGYTATRANLSAISELVGAIDPSPPIELMDFNPLAAAKYRRMGIDHGFPAETTGFSAKELSSFRAILTERGLSVR